MKANITSVEKIDKNAAQYLKEREGLLLKEKIASRNPEQFIRSVVESKCLFGLLPFMGELPEDFRLLKNCKKEIYFELQRSIYVSWAHRYAVSSETELSKQLRSFNKFVKSYHETLNLISKSLLSLSENLERNDGCSRNYI